MSKYEEGKIVNGCITGIEKYGAFVGLDEYYSGLIHISEISNNYVRDVNDYVNIGETVKVKIMEVDEENFQLKLSIKDIDYRNNRKRRTKICEIGSGFGILKENLDNWILKKNKTSDEKNKI